MSKLWKQVLFILLLASPVSLVAQKPGACVNLPDSNQLKSVLTGVVKEGSGANSGLGNQEWAALVNRDGIVCAIVFSGPDRGSQWPGSRVIAAVKASTTNAFSTSNYALSTANLYAAAQPGGSLYGIISPPNPAVTTSGDANTFGQPNDPMVGKAPGGVIVFGGGLALYDSRGKIVGGLGVSGDTACADHIVAWKIRHALKLDSVPMGAASGPSDNLILDISNGVSASGFGHPSCKGGQPPDEILKTLNDKIPVGARR
jgi:Haem-degrading